MDIVDQDQTARSVQSDLDLHCPQKFRVSSLVRKELRERNKLTSTYCQSCFS